MTSARAAAAACCALSALAGGCGGDDDTKAGYERALNGFCSAMERATDRVKTDFERLEPSQGGDARQTIRRIGEVIGGYATSIDGAGAKLDGAEVPGDYEDLHAGIVKGTDTLVARLRTAAAQVAAGNPRGVDALRTTSKLLPSLPADLAKKTPACGRIT